MSPAATGPPPGLLGFFLWESHLGFRSPHWEVLVPAHPVLALSGIPMTFEAPNGQTPALYHQIPAQNGDLAAGVALCISNQ